MMKYVTVLKTKLQSQNIIQRLLDIENNIHHLKTCELQDAYEVIALQISTDQNLAEKACRKSFGPYQWSAQLEKTGLTSQFWKSAYNHIKGNKEYPRYLHIMAENLNLQFESNIHATYMKKTKSSYGYQNHPMKL